MASSIVCMWVINYAINCPCVFAIKTRNNRLLYLIWTVIVIDIYNSLIVNIFAMIVKVCTDQLFGVSFTV